MTIRNYFSAIAIATVINLSFSSAPIANAESKSSSSSSASAISGPLKPIFAAPADAKVSLIIYLVGRDQDVVSTMDWSRQANATRLKEIQQIATSFRAQPKGSPQSIQLGETLLKLLEEHALYVESLKVFGIKDPSFPRVESAIKSARTSVAAQATFLAAQFPKAPQIQKWKAAAVISRLLMNDSKANSDAIAFIKFNKSPEAVRVQLLALAIDQIKGSTGNQFGSLGRSLDIAPDAGSKAALTLLIAEKTQNTVEAITQYQDAAKAALPFRSIDGKSNPITVRAASRVATLAVQNSPNTIDPETLSFFQSIGVPEVGHAYSEQIALRTAQKQPRQAISIYQSIQEQPNVSAQKSLYIEHRALDIALTAKDPDAAETQWSRIAKIPKGGSVTGGMERATNTQIQNWSIIEKSPKADAVERFVRVHDMLIALFPEYSQNDAWKLKVVDSLFRAKKDQEAASRGDALANESKSVNTQASALRFSARARERLMSIPFVPDFSRSRKLEDKAMSDIYIASLNKLSKIGSPDEQQTIAFQIPYVQHVAGEATNARPLFESAVNKYPKTKFSAETISFLLFSSKNIKDVIYIEKIARLAEKLRITPSNTAHADLRGIIENAVWDQANNLMEANSNELAGNRFAAFQKEFSRVKRADIALDLGAKCYLKAEKPNEALGLMETLLQGYPSSRFAKETRWQAGETARATKQKLRAATHYEAFATGWPTEALTRKALYIAGDLHLSIGRFAHAATDLEKYLATTSQKSEKVKVAKEIADLHEKYGKSPDAIGALERVIKVSGNIDDEFWARAKMLEIYMRQGQKVLAKSVAAKIVSMKGGGTESAKIQANAKFELGKAEAEAVVLIKPMESNNLYKATVDLMQQYGKARTMLLAPCESESSKLCSVANYEVSKMADELLKTFLDIEAPATIDPKEGEKVDSAAKLGREKLKNDVQSYAYAAEQSLSQGVPDEDWADRIRLWAKVQRGENQPVEPTPLR